MKPSAMAATTRYIIPLSIGTHGAGQQSGPVGPSGWAVMGPVSGNNAAKMVIAILVVFLSVFKELSLSLYHKLMVPDLLKF